ncbi:uncharacterized protein LOC127249847 [Andrographis paniculata]|uniref:uncharacterized protein LOC127249847 n=1 Tax=Andrographis paniculata TaxID=175694 RepID=UPI0021E6EE51|nr:uncharacterized protein LOC127249847 [Andrographis paniculata]
MSSLWISLKQDMHCCNSLTDVACYPAKDSAIQSYGCVAERKLNHKVAVEEEDPLIKPQFRAYNIRNRFQELDIGDPTRNIVEMIFGASSSNVRKRSRRVRRVLKVNNSAEALHKFEEYREDVKKASFYGNSWHPRSAVDGNEMRQFYTTTMNCCGRKMAPQGSQLCVDPTCRVCRVIQSGFDTSYNRMFGIRLSMYSDVASEEVAGNGNRKGKNVKGAVIICRTIAGKLAGVDGKGLIAGARSLVLCDPTAVLPCFVVVFD